MRNQLSVSRFPLSQFRLSAASPQLLYSIRHSMNAAETSSVAGAYVQTN